MADRYAVATGNWNDNNTWSASSGGAAGASFPTSADNVFLDATSGAITVTITVSASCLSLDCTGFTGTLTRSAGDLNVHGSMTLVAGMTFSPMAGDIYLRATSGSHNVTFAGKTFGSSTLRFTATSGTSAATWTLLDNASFASMVHSDGNVVFSTGITVTCTTGAYNISETDSRSLTMNNANLICKAWTATNTTGLTFNAGTGTITMQLINGSTFASGGLTYNNVVLTTSSAIASTFTITGAFTCANLTISNTDMYNGFSVGANITVTGTFTATGAGTNGKRILIYSDTPGTARTITAATTSLTNVDFRWITGAGAAAWTGTSVGNALGNSGITFTGARTLYWVNASGSAKEWENATNYWSLSSGGSIGEPMPLPQDTAIFDLNSGSAASNGLSGGGGGSLRVGTVTGVDGAPGINSGNRHWEFHGSLTMWTAFVGSMDGNTEIYMTNYNTSVTITSNGKTLTSRLYIHCAGGTVTLADALNVGSSNNPGLRLYYGTFVDAGFNVTCSGFNSNNSNVRTLTKTGAWTLTGNGTIWDTDAPTNFTFSDSGSVTATDVTSNSKIIASSTSLSAGNVTFNAAAGTKSLSGSWNNVSITGTGAQNLSAANFTVRGNFTIASMAPVDGANTITFAATSGTKTITTNGVSVNRPLVFDGVGGTWQLQDALTSTRAITLTNGTLTTNNFSVSSSDFLSSNTNVRVLDLGTSTWALTGAGGVWTCTTSTNMTLNAGTSTIVAGSSNSTVTMAMGTGLTYNNVSIVGSGANSITISGTSFVINGTLTVGASRSGSCNVTNGPTNTIKNLTFATGCTATWSGNDAFSLSGNLTLVSGLTLTKTGTMTFIGTSTHTITCAGKTLGFAVIFNGTGGSWALQDAFNTSSTLLVSQGTYDLNGQTSTATSTTVNGASAIIAQTASGTIVGTFTLTQGTIALGANTLTAPALSTSNSNARAITGTGTLRLTGAGTAFDASTATNLTVTSTTTIELNNNSASSKTFAGGGAAYGNLTLTGGGSGVFIITGNNSFQTINIGTQTIHMTAGTTTTLAALHNMPGAVWTSATAANHTLAKSGGGNAFLRGATISRSTVPADTFYAVESSVDGGNNINWNFGEFTSFVADAVAEGLLSSVELGSVVVSPDVAEAIAEATAGGFVASPRPNAETFAVYN